MAKGGKRGRAAKFPVDLSKLSGQTNKTVKGDKGEEIVPCKIGASMAEYVDAFGGSVDAVLVVLKNYVVGVQTAPIRAKLNTNIVSVLTGLIQNTIKSFSKLGVILTPTEAADRVLSGFPIPVKETDRAKAIEKASE